MDFCRNMPCFHKCYANRLLRRFPDIKKAWEKNIHFFKKEPKNYFKVINRFLTIAVPRYFRWHVGGELPSREYLQGVINIAEKHKKCRFLLYTKRYDLLLNLTNTPENLSIIMSIWPGLDYPNLPFRKAFISHRDKIYGFKCVKYCPDCKWMCWNGKDDISFDLT